MPFRRAVAPRRIVPFARVISAIFDNRDGQFERYTEGDMPVAFAEIGALITRERAVRSGRPIIAGTG